MDLDVEGVQYSGLLVALVGFGVTRFVVAETIQLDATVPFLVGGLVPLVVGLSLSVFGVALAVGPFERHYVRTVTTWTLVGTVAMVVVLATALLNPTMGGDVASLRESGVLVANVLLGGAVGGTITGDRAGRHRVQREKIGRQADRAVLINRILRHEVLNAATIVRGYAELLEDGHDEGAAASIREAAERIDTSVDEVGDLVEDGDETPVPIDVRAVVEDVRAAVDGPITVTVDADGEPFALADDRLRIVVHELVENAIRYGASGGEPVAIEIGATEQSVRIAVVDDGDGMPAEQREALERGHLPEYDDPSTGFGLQIVRLLIAAYDGSIDVTVGEGTRVTVVLPRASADGSTRSPLGVSRSDLRAAAAAALVAGVGMGLAVQVLQGLLPIIGALYGVQSQAVGWITHLFHSVVFGLLFAAIRSRPRLAAWNDGPGRTTLLGAGWGIVLWLVAAGLIMPAWLLAVGVTDAMVPNLTGPGLLGHLLWGVLLGFLYGVTSRPDAE